MGLDENPEGDYEDHGYAAGGWHTPVYIEPDGTVQTLDYWPGADESGMESFYAVGFKPKQQGWHFGNWEKDSWEPATRYPEELEPWEPGKLGKGVISPDGQVHTWQIDEHHGRDGYPSHEEALGYIHGLDFDEGLERGFSFYRIDHNGQFDCLLNRNAEHMEAMRQHLPQEPRCDGCGAKVHPDHDGAFNCGACGWRGDWHEPVENEWRFGSSDDPYYDPDFENDDAWEERMGEEMKRDMHRAPDEGEIDALIERGVRPGVEGKGLELPDGRVVEWEVDGSFGWPHHQDVARHLDVRVEQTVPLDIHVDGTREQTMHWQDDKQWDFA